MDLVIAYYLSEKIPNNSFTPNNSLVHDSLINRKRLGGHINDNILIKNIQYFLINKRIRGNLE